MKELVKQEEKHNVRLLNLLSCICLVRSLISKFIIVSEFRWFHILSWLGF